MMPSQSSNQDMFRKRKETDESVSIIDLNSGMIDAVINPPEGFVSKFDFAETDLKTRLESIHWFVNCGKPVTLDLTMPLIRTESLAKAVRLCNSPEWEDATLAARNQLTIWLHLNDKARNRNWNQITMSHKRETLDNLIAERVVPFQKKHGLDVKFVQCVRWDILAALMENSYMESGHQSFFFLELLLVYEAGHFPCGWEGEFPNGKLFVY